jgi:mannose-6-phosphate isomerase-like protein (cupin superfamily)
MKEAIKSADACREFYTAERCYITELWNTAQDPDVSIARARVEPGVTTCWHRLIAVTERYCILSGQGRVEVGELPPRELVAGDTVLIAPMQRQRITNVGSEDLIFLAICTPRFSDEAYEDLEQASTSI